MKKIKKLQINIFHVLMCLFSICINGQGKNYIEELNRFLPQPPGTSSLMKFEEVPVSLYTGIPEVSIPIENFSTNSQKLNLNISLNYHPLNAKVDDVASEYGLGWSLFAGGMISRTIRDLPDESNSSDQKYGMYYNNNADIINKNNYNLVKSYLLTGGSTTNNDVFKHIFESALFNKFDNSYDLYQYNFMGYTGRFFVKRDETTDALKLIKLDKNNLKIEFYFDSNNVPQKFEIADDKGIRYVFDTVEQSSRSYLIDSRNSSSANTNSNVSYSGLNTGFYLSKIYENQNLLIKFNYGNVTELSQSSSISKRRGMLYPHDIAVQSSLCYDDIINTFPADFETSITSNLSYTPFLENIEIVDRAKVYFDYVGNREDTNLAMPNNNKKLNKITIKSFYGDNLIKQFVFGYSYSQNIYKKMILNTVNIVDKNLQNDYSYKLSYGGNGKQFVFAADDVRSDLWGHYRCMENTRILDLLAPSSMYQPSPHCIEKDVLTKMTLPTGGEIRYNYELNTFNFKPRYSTESDNPSANPIEEITDFSDNLKNWDAMSSFITINNFGQSPIQFFIITEPQEILFYSENGSYTSEPWALNFYKLNEATGQIEPTTIQSLGPLVDVDPYYNPWQRRNFSPGKYYAALSTVSGNMPNNPIPTNFTARFSAYYRKPNNSLHYLYGGGIRIKNAEFYNESGLQKKKVYEYNDINDTSKSSGALVSVVPVLQYEEGYHNMYMCNPTDPANAQNIDLNMAYNTTATKNIFSPEKTKGADVGYKYVTVKDIDYTNNNVEISKGKTVHNFSSPIDFPNPLFSILTVSPPVAYTSNFDYRRGNLLSKKMYNGNNDIVYEENNKYDDSFSTEISALNLITSNNFIFNRFNTIHVNDYQSYRNTMNKCSTNATFHLCQYTSAMGFTVTPLSFVHYYFSKEIVGRSNLIKSEKTEYYPNGKKLITIDRYEYNGLDYPKKISNTTSDNIINETSYKYSTETGNAYLLNKNIVSIPLETEVKKDGKIISKTETLYPASQSEADLKTLGLALPYQVNSTDLLNVVSTEVTYDKYDDKGNLLQYTRDGVVTSIIWGYNKTLPIAKIIGIDYTSISASFGDVDIVNASNTDAGAGINNDETSLLNTLAAFRNAYSRHQVTTYTYDPLVGVRSITPPSGIREVYIYDSANRLKEVREQNQTGKVLKEYQYHYKN